jgi:hypothetical protein
MAKITKKEVITTVIAIRGVISYNTHVPTCLQAGFFIILHVSTDLDEKGKVDFSLVKWDMVE